MKLRHNTVVECPECGCSTIVKEEVEATYNHRDECFEIHTHTNGDRWERRTFLCGYSTQYVPNFQSCQSQRECAHNPAFKDRKRKREKLQRRIRELQQELNEV